MTEMAEAAAWYAERGLDLDTAFLDEASRVLGEESRYMLLEQWDAHFGI
jgi:hypothetical protein